MHSPTTLLAAFQLLGVAVGADVLISPPNNLVAAPYAPSGFQLPFGYNDRATCIVPSTSADAGPDILKAVQECNDGGTVLFSADETYTVSTPLDLTFLANIDIAILGTIIFDDTPGHWINKTFNYAFQGASLFWRFGGKNVRIYGNGQGTIDGKGQTYWNQYKSDSAVLRPILIGTDGLNQSSISGLNLINPPNWFHFIANSTNVLISDMNMNVIQLDPNYPAKNTDGWDTYRSSNIVIQNSKINNTDDCVAFKPNSTSVVVQNLSCQGCHGISVGSLGNYLGEIDIVEDIYIYNNTLTRCGDIGKIKVWPGAVPGGGTSSGGGTGHVRNITWASMHSVDNDEVILITQCYGSTNQSICSQYPSSLIIEDIYFQDFTGTLTSKYDPKAGSLVCSSSSVCSGIHAENIDVTEPSGKDPTFTCTNVDTSLLDISCV